MNIMPHDKSSIMPRKELIKEVRGLTLMEFILRLKKYNDSQVDYEEVLYYYCDEENLYNVYNIDDMIASSDSWGVKPTTEIFRVSRATTSDDVYIYLDGEAEIKLRFSTYRYLNETLVYIYGDRDNLRKKFIHAIRNKNKKSEAPKPEPPESSEKKPTGSKFSDIFSFKWV